MKSILPVVVLSLVLLFPHQGVEAASSAKKPTSKKLRKEAKKLRKAGQALAKKSRYEEALVVYAKALKTYEAYPMVYNEIGVIYFLQDDLVKASSSFRRALALYPDLSVAWANLAEVDRKRERYGDSALNYKEFIARRPNVADGFYGLALALMAQEKKAGALWAMKRFVALEKRADPQKVSEVQARVTLLEKEGVQAKDTLRIEEAIAAVSKRRAEAKAKKKERIKAHKGDRYYADQKYIAALSAYKKQLKKRKKKTKDPSLHYKIGATYAALRDYRAAMAWWGKALALAPKRAIIFEHLVLAAVQAAKNGQLDLGDPGTAEERLTKASDAFANDQPSLALAWLVEPGDDKSRYLRGRAALAGGNLILAKKCFEKLHSAYGEDTEIAAALAETLYRLKRVKAAKGVLAKLPSLQKMDEQSLVLRQRDALPKAFEKGAEQKPTTEESPAVPKDGAAGESTSVEPDSKGPEAEGQVTEPASPKASTIEAKPVPAAVEVRPSKDVTPKKAPATLKKVKKKSKPKRAAKPRKPKKAPKVKASKARKKPKRAKKKRKKKRKKKAALEDDDL